jgi:hypothetical protein
MTRNELAGVAQVMRWEFIDTDSGGVLSDNQVERRPWECIEDAHLLIERMVGDDYTVNIQIIPCPQPRYIMEAKRSNGRGYQLTLSHPTFPAAIVELFCRVFDIKED